MALNQAFVTCFQENADLISMVIILYRTVGPLKNISNLDSLIGNLIARGVKLANCCLPPLEVRIISLLSIVAMASPTTAGSQLISIR